MKQTFIVIPAILLIASIILLSGCTNPSNVPKVDKAKADLYIFSYCPAGTQTLDSFAKAGDLLKNVADVKVKFFANIHGSHELQENMIQECIQDINSAKYWDYANQYVAKVYNVCGASRSVECDKNESTKLMLSVGIDPNAVFTCVTTKGEALYTKEISDANALALKYSPSLVVNGTYIENADRTPNGIKTQICAGFITPPAECSQALSTTTPAANGTCG